MGGGSSNDGNSAKSVDKSEKSSIIKETSEKTITSITDSSIDKVPNVSINGYTSEQCAEIQKQHKELLDYSHKNNDNKEIAFVFDSSLQNRKEFKGEDDKLDFGNQLYGNNLIVMHNHPRNSSYSLTDIDFFVQNSNVKTLTIVKNNGKVETLTKENNFDISIFGIGYKRLYKKIVKIIQKVKKINL